MRQVGSIVGMVLAATLIGAAVLLGVAGVSAAGRFFTECRGIPLADLQFTSDCEDALSTMIAAVVAIAIAAVMMLISHFRRGTS